MVCEDRRNDFHNTDGTVRWRTVTYYCRGSAPPGSNQFPACLVSHLPPLFFNPQKQSAKVQYVASPYGRGTLPFPLVPIRRVNIAHDLVTCHAGSVSTTAATEMKKN